MTSFPFTRFVVVVFPLRAGQWCNSGRARNVSLVICLASIAYALPYFIFGRADPRSSSGGCMMIARDNPYTVAYMWSVVATGLAIPFTVICSLNGWIAYTLYRRMACGVSVLVAGAGVENMGSSVAGVGNQPTLKRGSSKSQDSQALLVRILFLVTFTFLTLNSPQLIRIAYKYLTASDQAKSLQNKANSHLAHCLTNNASNLNYSINFFLYFFSGTKFRKDLKELFLSCFGFRRS